MAISKHTKQQTQLHTKTGGFTLPTVLIISLILLIIGVSTLQVNSAVNRSLVDQNWNLLAKTAAESGAVFANSCLKQAIAWPSDLKPGMNCDGTVASPTQCPSPSDPCIDTDTSASAAPSRWQSTYIIGAPVLGSDGLRRSQITGKIKVLAASGVVVKTYNYSQDIILVIPLLPLPPPPHCDFSYPSGGGFGGGLSIGSGFLCLNNNTIGGAVIVGSGGGISSINSTIGGGILAKKTPGPRSITLCNTQVGGGVDIENATGLVLLGDDVYACPGNIFNGAVILQANQAGVSLFGNSSIGGTGTIQNNAGGAAPETIPKVGNNTFNSGLACSGNAPSLTNHTRPNSVAGTRTPTVALGGQCPLPF